MPALILPRRFYSQPRGAGEFDWDSPFAEGVTMVWTPSMASTDMSKTPVVGTRSTTAAISDAGCRFGRAQNFNQNGLQLPGSFTPPNPSGISALIIGGRPPTGQSWSMGAVSPHGAFRKWLNEYTIHSRAGGGHTRMATAAQWPVEPAVVIAGREGAGTPTAYRFWVNGASAANTYTNSASNYGITTYEVMQGPAVDRSAATYWAAPTALIVQWARYLSDDEVEELSANPWQIFRAKPRVLYFDVGGGAPSAPTLSSAMATSITATSVVPQVTLTFA